MSVSVKAVWGTTIRIELRRRTASDDEEVLGPLWSWFDHVDDVFSTWRDDSEISRLALGELELGQCHPDVAVVLGLCAAVNRVSDGAFDVHFAATERDQSRPGRCAIDPTGLVKGWAVERAAELLTQRELHDFSINAGGDVLVRSSDADLGARAWRIGIQHPWQRGSVAETVALANGAVATSGDYERGDHVIDPRSGRPAAGLASVTVIGPDLAVADGYATAAVALGREGMEWIASVPDVVAMGITDDQRVVKTAGFDEFVVR